MNSRRGPEWIKAENYNIEARIDRPAPGIDHIERPTPN